MLCHILTSSDLEPYPIFFFSLYHKDYTRHFEGLNDDVDFLDFFGKCRPTNIACGSDDANTIFAHPLGF